MKTKKVPLPVSHTGNGKESTRMKSRRDIISFFSGCQVAEVLYGI